MFRLVPEHLRGSDPHYYIRVRSIQQHFTVMLLAKERTQGTPKLLVLIIRGSKFIIKQRVGVPFHTIKRDRWPSKEATPASRRVYVPAGIEITASYTLYTLSPLRRTFFRFVSFRFLFFVFFFLKQFKFCPHIKNKKIKTRRNETRL